MKDWSVNRAFWLVPLALWAGLSFASYSWNVRSLEKHAMAMAAGRGRMVFTLVQTTRLWNARHGGVYAPISESTPSNPFLEVDERDIETPKGVKLTKVNPAYMTRQIGEVLQSGDLNIHLTSLNPLNPGNRADEWEAAALRAFETGVSERVEIVENEGASTFRFMAPLFVKTACLACHAKQGYEVGEVRGGLRVSFPAAPVLNTLDKQARNLIVVHGAVWLLLSLVTVLGMARVRRKVLSLNREKDSREDIIAQRTADLSREVAERKRSGDALRENEAFTSLLMASAGEGIIAVDTDGACFLGNPAALSILGYEGGLEGKRFQDIFPPSEGYGAIEAVIRDAEPLRDTRAKFHRADGSILPVEYHAHPIVRDGAVVGAVISFHDVSQRLEFEHKLARSNAELQQFAYAISHDLQEPLRVISGYVSLLEDDFEDELGEDAKEYIHHTTDATRRMSRMIKDLLDYSRIESKGAESQPVNVGDAVAEALANLRATIKEAEADILIDELPTVLADRGQTVRLFQNLVGNALKYRPENRKSKIIINSERRGNFHEFAIKDNGIGIESKNFEKIFGVFQRVHARTEYGGTGIGLAICKRIVERHGGDIWLESEFEKGATFFFTLPVAD